MPAALLQKRHSTALLRHSALLTGLVAAYTFEAAGNLGLDSSGRGNHLTNNNGATQVAGNAAPGTNGVRFTAASSQSLSIASNASLQLNGTSWELTCWLKMATLPGGGFFPAIIGKWGNTGTTLEYVLYFDGGNQRVTGKVSPDGAAEATVYAQSLNAGVWTFIDLWFDLPNTTLHLYIDGAPSLGVPTVSLASTNASTNLFKLGVDNFNTPFLNGTVDGANLWKRLLTPAERTTLYSLGLGLEYPYQ